jgi:hypothetical protein
MDTQALTEEIDNWIKMIEFAETQDKEGYVLRTTMIRNIDLDWTFLNSPLCEMYASEDRFTVTTCGDCPVFLKYGQCGRSKKNKWGDVNDSGKWGRWATNAKEFLHQLQSLSETWK